MYNTYLYQNNIGSVNKNLLSGASAMAQLDVSENQLSDGSLAFVPEGKRSPKLNLNLKSGVTRTL